jgi:hypothetical protein
LAANALPVVGRIGVGAEHGEAALLGHR